uniref:Uncharacterized protein n=1 Tax=Timema bartmani TaxID=61472 RepID=A0A7R9ESF7_9NEOP|nr:unnamed protein product [Timema bartmani]
MLALEEDKKSHYLSAMQLPIQVLLPESSKVRGKRINLLLAGVVESWRWALFERNLSVVVNTAFLLFARG